MKGTLTCKEQPLCILYIQKHLRTHTDSQRERERHVPTLAHNQQNEQRDTQKVAVDGGVYNCVDIAPRRQCCRAACGIIFAHA